MPAIIGIFMCIPIIVFSVMLLLCYKINSSEPVIWSYCIEIVTCCICILAFFRNAGFAFERPMPYRAIYLSMLAAFMCLPRLPTAAISGFR